MRTTTVEEGYAKFRGHCKELCEELVKADPSLQLVRGHVLVTLWPSDPEQPHWWCVRPDGSVVDPSWEQFPFQEAPPAELYIEFDGTVCCSNCGKEGKEENFHLASNYAFCSDRCYGRFVGLDV